MFILKECVDIFVLVECESVVVVFVVVGYYWLVKYGGGKIGGKRFVCFFVDGWYERIEI